MKRDEYLKLQDDSFNRRKDIFLAKTKDYATDDDCLSNFKRVARILSIFLSGKLKEDLVGSDVSLIYIVLKMDRFMNLKNRGVSPENESMEDNVEDWKNYLDLLDANYREENKSIIIKDPKLIELCKNPIYEGYTEGDLID